MLKKLKIPAICLLLGALGALLWPYLPSVRVKPPEAPAVLEIAKPGKKTETVTASFEVRVRQLVPSMRMVVATVLEDASVTRSDPNWWWGDLVVRADAPVRLTYSVDLAKASSTWDGGRRLLSISVPDVAIEAVEVQAAAKRTTESQGWCRWQSDVDAYGLEAERGIPQAAKALASQPHLLEKARIVGIPALRQALHRVLKAVAGEDALIEIEVRQQP